MIMWLIGLSGAGKSTLAEAVVNDVRRRGIKNIVLVDGDVLREVWGNDLGHSLEDRKKNADRLCRLCAYLESQNIHAVCAILSLFEESRQWNRENLNNYYEVYIKTSLEDLIKRDSKGLYKKALAGETELPGVNINFPEPVSPDEVILNGSDVSSLLNNSKRLSQKFYAVEC